MLKSRDPHAVASHDAVVLIDRTSSIGSFQHRLYSQSGGGCAVYRLYGSDHLCLTSTNVYYYYSWTMERQFAALGHKDDRFVM